MVIINNLPSIVRNDNWNPRPDKINPNISGMTGENDGSTLPRLSVGSYELLVKLRLPTYFCPLKYVVADLQGCAYLFPMKNSQPFYFCSNFSQDHYSSLERIFKTSSE